MNVAIKSLPIEERPRERLVRFGADVLATSELLAILLGSGMQSRSVLQLAQELLSHFQSLNSLADASLQELQEVKGIGLAKAIQLQAVFALMKRKEEVSHPLLDTPEKIYTAIRGEMEGQKSEALLIFLRDVKRRLIHREIISRGTLTEILLHPREVFHAAIKHRAHSLIIAHNHPSGDSIPSSKDVEMTQILAAAGRIVGIPLADHLIVGKNGYFSFCEKKLLSPQHPY